MAHAEEITNAAAWAAQLEGRGTGSFHAVVVSVTARLPVYQVAILDAMARQAGTSRTYALSQLLAAGIDATTKEIEDTKTRTAIRKAQGARLAELLADSDVQEGEER